jgi:hypothetical protein
MSNIELKKSDIPFWFGGDGTLKVELNVLDPTKEIPVTDNNILAVDFSIGGSQPFSIGANDSFKFAIDASANAALIPLWSSSSAARLKLLDDYGLHGFFDGGLHSGLVLLLLKVGAKVDASLNATFKYMSLTATASLAAGADGNYALIRSFPSNTPAVDLIKNFLGSLRLPANIDGPLHPDEVIVFEYGGYVRFNGTLGVGYELSGSSSFEISQLQFAENYAFTLMAKVGIAASVAGNFRIVVKPGSEAGWAQVVLHKQRSSSLAIAADVSAITKFEQEGLPENADEFLSAVIGLKSKNWIGLFQQVHELSDFNKLQVYLDDLAKSFIEKYTGKVFEKLAEQTNLDEVVNLVGKVIDQYNAVGDNAVTLFDKYFNIATGVIDGKLTEALAFIKNATSWDQLKGQIDGTLWDVVQQLTDGDPLSWFLGKIEIDGHTLNSLDEIKTRADKVLALIQDQAHEEIRRLIALAKSQFPLDKFLSDLGHIDWMTLQTLADRRLTGFVERLLGQSIKGLNNTQLGKAVTKFHGILDGIDNFKNTLYKKIKETLDQSFSFQLHAEYSRASENDVLLNFEVNLNTAKGQALMKAAGSGDFSDVLAAYSSGEVRLNEGVLTHKVTRQSKFSVNITGWHLGWNYQGLDRVITEAEQRIIPEGNGQLSIITMFDMQKERERKRNGERVYTNLLLRFIGESHGVVEFDKANQVYLVDAITGMSANYTLVYQDPNTDEHELARYLSFADDFGLAASDDAALQILEPLLLRDAQGNFGETSITYTVRFTKEGLVSLFEQPFGAKEEMYVRRTMRLIVLANYLNKGPTLTNRAWCYWTPGIQAEWAKGQAQFTNHSSLTFSPIAPSPLKNLAAPSSPVTLKQPELFQLSTLYYIEENVVKGMRKLSSLIQSKQKLNPRDFEKALGDFGSALKSFDDFDEGDNTVFAIFDKLIDQYTGGQYRNSSLELKSTLNGTTVTKMLVA